MLMSLVVVLHSMYSNKQIDFETKVLKIIIK